MAQDRRTHVGRDRLHPSIEQIKSEIQGAGNLLRQPCGDTDVTLRQLLADGFYAEKQQTAILDWLPKVEARLDEIVSEYETALKDKDTRISDLETEVEALRLEFLGRQPVDIEPAPALLPVEEITGHVRAVK